ncbi:MAG: PilT/PilU family type 4a pilus ATPase [Firmicutes bacterium]|nr:PilT/PilU family type 4a pilus ATPase [Bacillota bacterium]MBR0482344.1 PilT/PilU family type 4a pilus ATPase [Bacillota bacterium]
MELLDYLKWATENGASDIFIVAGTPLSAKKDGMLLYYDEQKLMPDMVSSLIEEIYTKAGRDMSHYLECGDDDFSFAVGGLARFRVNTYMQRGSMASVIRVVHFEIPDWREIGIPQAVMELSNLKNGMVLVTGTAGSGKSTTLACIIEEINRNRGCHIITLEDPIEFLHKNNRSIVSQREIAIDTADALSGLRACLRQAPDVIQLGEMRDKETISTAMTAAETGHLLLATLHTKDAVNTIDRIIDTFPSEQQSQIRIQLGGVLQTVVCQQLLPASDGGRVPAFEIMNMTNAVKSLIRDGKTHQIDNVIASGAADGMISMDQSIYDLWKSGRITKETALAYAVNPEQMKRRIG